MHVSDTSAQALASISLQKRKSLVDEVEAAVLQLQRLGARDCSMREIQRHMEAATGRRIDVSSISARLNELEAAKRVARDRAYSRPCTITGQSVHPVSIPPTQQRMFG